MWPEFCPIHGNRRGQPVLEEGSQRHIHPLDFAPSRLPPELKQRFGMIANRRTEIVVAALVNLEIKDLWQDPAVLEEIVCGRWVLGRVRKRAPSRQPRDTAHRVNES